MRVAVYQVDGKMPNLALMKLSAWHKQQGDQVLPLNFILGADRVYASCIFSWNRHKIPAGAVAGGPGYDPKLTLPPDVEAMRPDYSLYPNCHYSLGYTWRDCRNHCPWCIVPQFPKEGKHHSIEELLRNDENGRPKVVLLNNNSLCDPAWTATWLGLREVNALVYDHGGFDVRLFGWERAWQVRHLNWAGQIHFAWDKLPQEKYVERTVQFLRAAGFGDAALRQKVTFYVLCGFDTTFEQDMYRVMVLRGLGVNPFVMLYQPIGCEKRLKHPWKLVQFARWVNRKHWFYGISFDDFMQRQRRGK